MTDTKIKIRKTCPACMGRGKKFGSRHCHYCHGNHKVTETVTISQGSSAVSEDALRAITKAVRETLEE